MLWARSRSSEKGSAGSGAVGQAAATLGFVPPAPLPQLGPPPSASPPPQPRLRSACSRRRSRLGRRPAPCVGGRRGRCRRSRRAASRQAAAAARQIADGARATCLAAAPPLNYVHLGALPRSGAAPGLQRSRLVRSGASSRCRRRVSARVRRGRRAPGRRRARRPGRWRGARDPLPWLRRQRRGGSSGGGMGGFSAGTAGGTVSDIRWRPRADPRPRLSPCVGTGAGGWTARKARARTWRADAFTGRAEREGGCSVGTPHERARFCRPAPRPCGDGDAGIEAEQRRMGGLFSSGDEGAGLATALEQWPAVHSLDRGQACAWVLTTGRGCGRDERGSDAVLGSSQGAGGATLGRVVNRIWVSAIGPEAPGTRLRSRDRTCSGTGATTRTGVGRGAPNRQALSGRAKTDGVFIITSGRWRGRGGAPCDESGPA